MKLRGRRESQSGSDAPTVSLRRLTPAIILSLAIHVALLIIIAAKLNIIYPVTSVPAAVDTGASLPKFSVSTEDAGGDGVSHRPSDAKDLGSPAGPAPPPLVAMSESLPIATRQSLETLMAVTGSDDVMRAGVVGGQGTTPVGIGVSLGGSGSAGWGIGGKRGLPAYLRNPPPPYPREAREHRWEGTTLLRVEVLADGTAGKVEIVESSGYPILDNTSVQTVQLWRFFPAHAGGVPVRSVVEIPITFRLAL